MVKRGHLEVPVIGVAKSTWNLEQCRARAKESVERHGGLDPAAFGRCAEDVEARVSPSSGWQDPMVTLP
jgi:hypothetical protein